MGAPASLAAKWIPEDDLLLKNSVENGASLESLAKGAVSFSRRFTIQELQDRWGSLLYDLDTSSEAAARIIEVEMDQSASDNTKTIQTCNSKGKGNSFRKRKGDSVRSHYYAMRKRVFNGPCGPADLSFLMRPSPHIIAPCGGYGDQLKPQNGIAPCGGYGDQLKPQNEHHCNPFDTGAPTSDHYGHFETRYDSELHAFRDQLTHASADASCDVSDLAYQAALAGSVEDELRDGIVGKDGFYEYTENILPLSVEKTGVNTEQSFDHAYTEEDIPLVTGENLVSLQSYSNVQEIEPPQEFARTDLYQNDDIEAKSVSGFNLTNVNHGKLCSDFIGNNNPASQAPESSGSLQQLEDLSAVPIWRIDDIMAHTTPMDAPYDKQGQEVFNIDNVPKMNPLGCDADTYGTKLDDQMSPGILDPSLQSEEDYMEYAFMDFPEDDALFCVNMDAKDNTDGPCLNNIGSILLSSPSGEHQDDVPNSSNHMSEMFESCLMMTDGLCSAEIYHSSDQMYSGNNDVPNMCVPQINLPTSSSGTRQITAPLEEFMICTLNTEDPDIPCNDGTDPFAEVLPQFPTSNLEQTSGENAVSVPSFGKVVSNDESANLGELPLANEEEGILLHPHRSSLEAEPVVLPKAGLVSSSDGCELDAESFKSSSISEVSGHAGIAIEKCLPCISATVPLQSVAPVGKEESKSPVFESQAYFDTTVSPFIEKSVQGPEGANSYPLYINDGCEQEVSIPATLQMDVPDHIELNFVATGSSDPVVHVLTSDQEEHSSSYEDNIPNFSDIESMILDMDLVPYDEESGLFANEVSKYQSVDARKAIIRLEQGARSYMNRSISSHGGFAIFYGRHLRYFIKEHEVSLGRTTDELEIDIDLSKEGPANKISRLQAFIKLDEDGTFALKNVGKCSIFVNGKEIQSKKRTNLTSGSLIEIKELRFIFEINQKAVLGYIGKLRGGSQTTSTQFDWVPV